MLFPSYQLEDIQWIIKEILKKHPHNENFFLTGPLGAGKTTFIRKFCQHLGAKEPIHSPTFSLMHQYPTDNKTIYHLDLYRLNDEDEVYDLGIEEILSLSGYKFIEWMDKFPSIPKQGLELKIEILPNFLRKLEISEVKLL